MAKKKPLVEGKLLSRRYRGWYSRHPVPDPFPNGSAWVSISHGIGCLTDVRLDAASDLGIPGSCGAQRLAPDHDIPGNHRVACLRLPYAGNWCLLLGKSFPQHKRRYILDSLDGIQLLQCPRNQL